MNYQVNKILRVLEDSVFPRTCPVCDKIVPYGQLICRECMGKLSFVRHPICEQCGKQVLTESQKLCYDCAHNERTFIKGRALLNYDDTARQIMTGIKYKNRREHAEIISKMLSYRLRSYIAGMEPDCLVPVPVHESRLRERGYNQAELFAVYIGRETGIPVRTDILYRTKQTAAMKNLTPKERRDNLLEAFAVNPEAFSSNNNEKPKRIMLVDDIYTTGATAEACTHILWQYGIETCLICACIGSDI